MRNIRIPARSIELTGFCLTFLLPPDFGYELLDAVGHAPELLELFHDFCPEIALLVRIDFFFQGGSRAIAGCHHMARRFRREIAERRLNEF